jgi:hypothetical protein
MQHTQKHRRIPWMLCQPIKNTLSHLMQWHFHSPSPPHNQPHLSRIHHEYNSGILNTTPPNQQTAPSLSVELTTGFRLLGQPVGSLTFATTFLSSRVEAVKESLRSLLTSITDEQTKLRLFSQCLLQRLPHLLSSDINLFNCTARTKFRTSLLVFVTAFIHRFSRRVAT